MRITWPWQKKDKLLTPADLARELLATASAKSGVAVTWQTALRASTALACARVIGEGLAQVPLKVMQSRKSGGSDVVYDHPLYPILHDVTGADLTSYEWRETAGIQLVFAGAHYAYKVTDTAGRLLELMPLDPGNVTKKRSGTGDISYSVRMSDGQAKPFGPDVILELRGPSWNSWQGLDGVKLAREAIGMSLAAEEHGAKFFSNGARVGGIVSTDQALTEPQLELLRKTWNEQQGGLENAYKTAFLFGGMKFMPATMQNDQAQMVELRNQQVEEICRAFRVLPIMVGYSDKTATYASAEQMFLAHVVHTMGPWYTRIEQRLNMSLLTAKERADGLYCRFNVAGLLRGSHEARANYYSKALGAGGSPAWITQDEVRALEDLNPLGGAAAVLPIATNVPQAPGA